MYIFIKKKFFIYSNNIFSVVSSVLIGILSTSIILCIINIIPSYLIVYGIENVSYLNIYFVIYVICV